MFNSKFSQRMLKSFLSPKTFLINYELKIGNKYFLISKKVVSRFRSQAMETGKCELKESIEIIYRGSKCLGKTQPFNNEL